MDPRFGKNHQLHLLLKKRTYMADHELYEMMKSKQVYRVQNELRRELERRLRTISQDEKVRVASFMVQKATFVKMMAARQKGLRHLVNVKDKLGDDFTEDLYPYGDAKENDEYIPAPYDDPDMPFYKNTNYGVSGPDQEEGCYGTHDKQVSSFVQSVNKDWMDSVTGGNPGKEKSSTKKSDTVKIHIYETCDNERPSYNRNDQVGSKDFQKKSRINKSTKETDTSRGGNDSTMLPKLKLITDDHFETSLSKQTEYLSPFQKTSVLPEIQKSKRHGKKTDKSIILPKAPEMPERERTVSMIFVEDDDDDEDYPQTVSLFDIEAFLKYRQSHKRGHTIIISSKILHENGHRPKDNEKNPDSAENKPKKTAMTTKRPFHSNSWGVKRHDGMIRPLERRKQWYQKFLGAKNSKKLHDREKQRSNSNESDHSMSQPQGQCHTHGEVGHTDFWKGGTGTTSDSQNSAEMMCEMRLQQLKHHCRKLNERVALFVSS